MNSGSKIIAASEAIIESLDSFEDLEDKHRRAACLRATMIYYVRSGYSFEDFKALMDMPQTETCYLAEVEHENS